MKVTIRAATIPNSVAVCDFGFAGVARLIHPSGEPEIWLQEHLERWIPSFMVNRQVQAMQPTRKEMVKRLNNVAHGAHALAEVLSDIATREFLEIDDVAIDSTLRSALHLLSERARRKATSSMLVNTEGKTASGRGKAQIPGALSAKTYCALIICEAWKYLRGDYPGPKSRHAAEAAETYWLASGLPKKDSWGTDQLAHWAHDFRLITKQRENFTQLRSEIERHLILSSRKQSVEGG